MFRDLVYNVFNDVAAVEAQFLSKPNTYSTQLKATLSRYR